MHPNESNNNLSTTSNINSNEYFTPGHEPVATNYTQEKPLKNKKNVIYIIIISILSVAVIILTTALIININNNSSLEEFALTSEESGPRTVGEENYGYITIPEGWVPFFDQDAEDTLQFSSEDGNNIVTLFYVPTNEINASQYIEAIRQSLVSGEEATDVNYTNSKLAGYDAYQLSAYYPGDETSLYVWIFEADDNNTHYIALEGSSDNISEYTYIPESFSLTSE